MLFPANDISGKIRGKCKIWVIFLSTERIKEFWDKHRDGEWITDQTWSHSVVAEQAQGGKQPTSVPMFQLVSLPCFVPICFKCILFSFIPISFWKFLLNLLPPPFQALRFSHQVPLHNNTECLLDRQFCQLSKTFHWSFCQWRQFHPIHSNKILCNIFVQRPQIILPFNWRSHFSATLWHVSVISTKHI